MAAAVSSEEYPLALRLSMRDLLGEDMSYVVPKFQRDYCWDKEHLHVFWHDVMKAWENQNPHYFGSMLLVEAGDDTRLIVDGQQRLTTFTLFIMAAEKAMREFKGLKAQREDLNDEFRRFVLKPGEGVSHQGVARLRLNRHNQGLFDDMVRLLSKPTAKKISPFNERLVNALEVFDECFKGFSHPEQIVDFVNEALSSSLVTVIVTNDENRSYQIYECLNNRGKPLTESDLIKNHLFSMSEQGQAKTTDIVESCWNQLMSLGSERVDEYIRTVMMLEQGYCTRLDLLETVKSIVTSPDTARSFAENLRDKLDLYSAICDPDQNPWNDYHAIQKQHQQVISDLRVIGKGSQGTILMAAISRYKPRLLKRFFGLVENYIFRNNIICKNDLNKQDEFLSELGSKVWKKELPYAKVLELLQQNTPGDREFRRAFSMARFDYGPETKIIQYILRKFEMGGGAPKDFGKVTIEHVLPVAHTPDWRRSFNIDHVAASVNRLGNFTFLDGNTNSRLANKSFRDKRPVLAKSDYRLAKMIAVHDKWNYQNLCKHQRKMAEMAVEIW